MADESPELTARRAVVHAVRHIRRWDEPGILAEWDKAAKAGHDFVAVAVCLLETAADPTAQTPAVVRHRLANGWRRDIEPPTPLPQIPQCDDCHLRHAPDTPCGHIGGTEIPTEYVEAKREILEGR